jgi:hypothetical protein
MRLFSASHFGQYFEMTRCEDIVDRELAIFAHGVAWGAIFAGIRSTQTPHGSVASVQGKGVTTLNMRGGVQSPLTIDAAASNMFMSIVTWAMVLAAIVLILPKSTRRLAVLATLLQPAMATWTDTHAVVHSALSAYSDYVLIMVPVTLALAGAELAEFSCSTTRLVQAAANAMSGSVRSMVVHEHGQGDAKWAILLANSVANMATDIALEAARRADQWSQYASDSREPAWKQAHMATMWTPLLNAATLAMATALTCAAAAETVAYRGTLTRGHHHFATAPASSPAHHEEVELPLHERFAILVSEAYPAHAHKVRAVLCSYLRYRRTHTRRNKHGQAHCAQSRSAVHSVHQDKQS